MSRSIRRAMIDRDHQQLSLVRQCILLDVSRASVYYRPVPTRAEDLELMALMDRQYLKTPFYGSRKMKAWLLQQGYLVSRKRVRRLMRLMGLEAIYRRPNTSKPAPGHRIFPYLLKGVEVNRVDQVWAADITYIPMAKGFLYLVAIMDWHSRHVLAWKLSNTMDTSFCVAALEEALGKGRPEIFNTDQGSQFTSEAFTQTLQEQRVQVSMDGKGKVPGQHLRGAAVAEHQVRGGVSESLPDRRRGPNWDQCLPGVLQPAEASPGFGLPDPSRGVPTWPGRKGSSS